MELHTPASSIVLFGGFCTGHSQAFHDFYGVAWENCEMGMAFKHFRSGVMAVSLDDDIASTLFRVLDTPSGEAFMVFRAETRHRQLPRRAWPSSFPKPPFLLFVCLR